MALQSWRWEARWGVMVEEGIPVLYRQSTVCRGLLQDAAWAPWPTGGWAPGLHLGTHGRVGSGALHGGPCVSPRTGICTLCVGELGGVPDPRILALAGLLGHLESEVEDGSVRSFLLCLSDI